MGVRGNIFLTVFSFCLSRISATSDTCYKVNSCQCAFLDGRYIDLTPLASLTSEPKWKDNYDRFYNNRFSYNPCDSFTEGTCQNVAVCQINNAGQYFPCGTQSTGQFITDNISGLLAIEYSSNSQYGTTRYSRVLLNCIATSGDTFDVQGEGQTGHYGFKLNSQHCCPKQGPMPTPPGGDAVTHVGTFLLIGFGVVLVWTILIGLICFSCGGPSQKRGQTRAPLAPVRGQHPYRAMDRPPPYDHI
ncbi:unnamed protein product [Lymnaea stagnalis]|uniref:MRH domain-containing protein n=1 Tax=Lymnaea stagnalis TaxID=6523 RepID=A0AAV2I4Z0_LYMST